jgi:hypothetical protein
MKGIQYVIKEQTGTGANQCSTGSVGTLSRADVANWRNWSWGTAITAFNTSNAGRNAMNAMYQKCTYGLDKPDCIITTEEVWSLYELDLLATGTINMPYNVNMASLGFDNIAYKTKPLVSDKQCPSGNLYFINTKHLFVRMIKDKLAKVTEFLSPVNAPHQKLAYVQSIGTITTDGLRYLGVINSITG